MTMTRINFPTVLSSLLWATACIVGTSNLAVAQQKLSVYQATLEEPKQLSLEVTTEELKAILASGREPVFDTRPAKEYAVAHIPGSINLFEKEVERITQSHPDRATRIVLYCNGPFCGKSKRVAEDLAKLGYTAVRRYQLGLPVWRALGNTAQTNLEGIRYVLQEARTVAEEIAKVAYWNSSYFGGTYEELRGAGLGR